MVAGPHLVESELELNLGGNSIGVDTLVRLDVDADVFENVLLLRRVQETPLPPRQLQFAENVSKYWSRANPTMILLSA